MDPHSFRLAVRAANAADPNPVEESTLETALDWYVDHHPQPSDRAAALALARLWASPGDDLPSVPLSEGAKLDTERLTEAIAGWVESIRDRLSEASGDSGRLPFDSYADGVAWLERMRSEGQPDPPTSEDRERIKQLRQEIKEHGKELSRLSRSVVRFGERRLSVDYVEPGEDFVRSFPVRRDHALFPLAQEVEAVSKATGFARAVVVAHVLADVPPVLFPVTVATPGQIGLLPDGTAVWRQEVRVTLRSPELSEKDVLRLYANVRERWGAHMTNRLTEKDRRLWSAVQERGGEPEVKTNQDYWEDVRSEMAARHGWDLGWRAWQRRWERMQPKLSHLQISTSEELQ